MSSAAATPFTLSDVLGPQTYGVFPIEPQASGPAVRNFYNGNLAGFELDEIDTMFESNAADYLVEEDINAACSSTRS